MPESAGAGRPGRGAEAWRWGAVAAGLALVSVLHYATPPAHVVLHAVYQRGYYVPIILGAYWYGLRGGVLAALLASLAYVPHIHSTWSTHPAFAASQYTELILFGLVGVAVGLVTSHERALAAAAARAAASLAEANRELRESQEHLRRAERLSALGEISAGLAHEIRNPLAGIRGALEIIAGRAPAGSPEAEFSAIGVREVDKLDQLVSEFLAYSRKGEPERRPADVGALIRHVLALLQPAAERSGVSLERLGPAEPCSPIEIDARQIEQVLFNIVLNAVQASPRGGVVTVSCRVDTGTLGVEVRDRGPGIPPARLPRIFDPFFTTKERGTGLGLAISQRIVQAHGGRIEVTMPGEGGTLVRVALPAAASRAGDRPAPGGVS